MEPLLENEVAGIHGAGAIAGGVARMFAREDVRVLVETLTLAGITASITDVSCGMVAAR